MKHSLWYSSQVKDAQLCPTLWYPVDCSPPGFSVRGILQGITVEWVAISFFSRDPPNPGIQPRSPALQADSLPSEPPCVAQSCPTLCKPVDCSPPGSSVHGDSPGKNTGVGCHALLQGIFPTQGLNPLCLLSPALAGRFSTTSTAWEARLTVYHRRLLACALQQGFVVYPFHI